MLTSLFAIAGLLGAAPVDPQAGHRLVGLLQYLQSDYPAALESGDPHERAEQLGFASEALAAARALGEDGQRLEPRLESVRARIEQGEDPKGVSADCQALADEVIALAHLERSPRRPPDLARARALWATDCMVCHGERGDAQTAVAPTLKPPPANFKDPERMVAMTAYRAFNTTAFGITGTAMAPFPTLSESDRWALGFYVLTFRQPPCDHQPPHVALGTLATSTDAQLAARWGQAEVACLRQRFTEPEARQAFAATRSGIERALELSKAGQREPARSALVDAYLTHFEPVEPGLRATNPGLLSRIEHGFTQARVVAEDHRDFGEEGARLMALLDEAAAGQTRGDFWSVLLATALILLREGFEAMVVVTALLAVLKKMGATAHARVVHLGWVSALVAGAVAFVLGQELLAGANREWLEAVVAFASVGMLLYAALWLSTRVNTSRFMGQLREQAKGALGNGSRVGLFTIAFAAAGREAFETALFLQGLAGDSLRGVLVGCAVGALLLAALVAMVLRVGFRLPMKTLFNASTLLLVLTALMLLGQGVHGLQELGALPLKPLAFVQLDVLGLYPDALSLGAQAVLALLPLGLWALSRARASRAAQPPATA